MSLLNTSEDGRFALRKAVVQNFLGIKGLEHKFKGRLTLVTGPNASGKSSFAAALRGCVASNSDPLSLGERQLKRYAHNGSDKCLVEVELLDDDVRRSWAPASRKISGSVACPQKGLVIGLDTPFELRTDKEVNQFWDEVVTVKINSAQVMQYCRERLKSYPEAVNKNITGFITETMANFPEGDCNREEIRKFHGRLKVARAETMRLHFADGSTGILYTREKTGIPGNVKGANIMSYLEFSIPAEYDGSTPEDVDMELKRLNHDLNNKYYVTGDDEIKKYEENRNRWHEAMQRTKELTEKERELRSVYVVRVEQDDKRLEDLKAFVESAVSNVEKIMAEDKLAGIVMECPKCKASLSYDPDTKTLLDKVKAKITAETDRWDMVLDWRKKKELAENDITKLISVRKKSDAEIAEIVKAVDAAKAEEEVYRELVTNKGNLGIGYYHPGGTEGISLKQYRELVNKVHWLVGVKETIKRKRSAQRGAYKVQALDMLMDILDPGGVAAKQRERGFEYIQNTLRKLESASDSKFGSVSIDEEGRILIDGCPHALASKSERVWVNWLVQCTFAILYSGKVGYQLIVADEVDIFDDSQMRCFAKTVDYVLDEVKHSQVVLCGTGIENRKWETNYKVNVVEVK